MQEEDERAQRVGCAQVIRSLTASSDTARDTASSRLWWPLGSSWLRVRQRRLSRTHGQEPIWYSQSERSL